MPVNLYMDHHVHSGIIKGLRKRDVNVLTAFEDNSHRLADPDLLNRTTFFRRVLFTQDDDFLVEAARRQRSDEYFWGYGPFNADLRRILAHKVTKIHVLSAVTH